MKRVSSNFESRDKTPNQRLGRGGQEAVIAARVQTDDGGRGKAANPIGLQPLATESSVEVTARFFLELNHEFPIPVRSTP